MKDRSGRLVFVLFGLKRECYFADSKSDEEKIRAFVRMYRRQDMNFSPFSCPIFLGHPKARGRCSQGERVLYGRDLWCSGGTEKAEDAKLTGAGIWPGAVPRENERQKKGIYRNQ